MKVDANPALVGRKRFPRVSFHNILGEGRRLTEPKWPEGDRLPAALPARGLDTSNPGYDSVHRVPFACGVKPPNSCATSTWHPRTCPLSPHCGGRNFDDNPVPAESPCCEGAAKHGNLLTSVAEPGRFSVGVCVRGQEGTVLKQDTERSFKHEQLLVLPVPIPTLR